MFDTIVYRRDAPYPQNINVTEKRAPTDESVRLLREMEAAAEQRVVARFTSGNRDNVFSLHVLVRQDLGSPVKKAEVYYTLNGKQRSVSLDFDCSHDPQVGEWMRKLHEALAEDVAHAIVLEVFKLYAREGPK